VSAIKQRVPNADDFPVLAGTVTPPSKSCVTTNGPTAAQVLQAPPPVKKESTVVVVVNGSEPGNARLTTPEHPRSPATSTKVCISKSRLTQRLMPNLSPRTLLKSKLLLKVDPLSW